MSRAPDIVNLSFESMDLDMLTVSFCMKVVVRYWIGEEYRERMVCASMKVDRYACEDNLHFQEFILRRLLEDAAKEIRKEDEQLQNIHTPKPVRKVSPFKEEAGEVGGYSSKVPDILC